MSDKVRTHHPGRKAVLYVRQSSPGQVANNQEGRRLQYAMTDRLRELGWAEVEVIDEDQGRSASGTTARAGFERMVAEVCLGQVGAVAAREVSRFARNSREWQQLIEVCRMVDTLVIDQEMVYHPRLSNDRLLLGLKGSLNEYELDLLRQRAVAARNEKARRGDFVAVVPVGYLKGADGRLELDPDRRVQQAIRLVFHKLLELGAARQALLWFLEQGLELPARRPGPLGWETVWKRPTYSAVQRLLTNPAYGGAYAFGRTEMTTRYQGGVAVKSWRRRPREQWLALLPGHHDGYVSWEEFERAGQVLHGNNQRLVATACGAAKRGSALLAGLLRCRRCGRKLMVSYTGGNGRGVARYVCRRGSLDNAEPKCISFGGVPIDAAVGGELLRALAPAAVTAAIEAEAERSRQHDQVLAALDVELRAARYAADRAARQFDAADPANRLVADELERRWNAALERARDLEGRIEQTRRRQSAAPADRADLLGLARDLDGVWDDPGTDARLKKRLLRAVIVEVVADIDERAAEVVLAIHWQGGVHTESRVKRRRRGQCAATSVQAVEAVSSLARICPDETVAGFLNRNGLRTGRGNRWTRERVTSLRAYHQIAKHCVERQRAEGWLTLGDAAEALGVSPRTLRLAVEDGVLEGEHPLPEGPWVLNRRALETEEVRQLAERVHRHTKRGAVPSIEADGAKNSSR